MLACSRLLKYQTILFLCWRICYYVVVVVAAAAADDDDDDDTTAELSDATYPHNLTSSKAFAIDY